MPVTETLNEGLKRKLSVTIPAADLNSRLDAKLEELKGQANIKGFRPGKVPTAHLKKVYGRSHVRSDDRRDQRHGLRHARRAQGTRRRPAEGRPAAGPDRHQRRAGRQVGPRLRSRI